MSKIDNIFGVMPVFNNKYQTSANTEQPSAQQISKRSPVANDNFLLNNQSAIGMKIVFQSVSSRFSASASFSEPIFNYSFDSKVGDTQKPAEETKGLFDFEKVAETVMAFVSSSLYAAKGRGANDQELEEMLSQARAGVNQGIDEALGELEELSLLNEDLTIGIEKSRDLISQGIDKLTEQLFPDVTAKVKEDSTSLEELKSHTSEITTSASRSSDLTITTADGDLVKIFFSDYQSHQQTSQYTQQSNDSDSSAFYQSTNTSYREVNFSFSIEGELDDDEKSAISALIKDINKLQKDFFNGNIEKAYQQVLQLGFDDEQLSSMSLDLQQQQTSTISQSYSEVASYQDSDLEQINKQLKPIMSFVEHFKQLREMSDKLFEKEEQGNKGHFNQLLQSVFKAEFGENDEMQKRFNHFIEKLA